VSHVGDGSLDIPNIGSFGHVSDLCFFAFIIYAHLLNAIFPYHISFNAIFAHFTLNGGGADSYSLNTFFRLGKAGGREAGDQNQEYKSVFHTLFFMKLLKFPSTGKGPLSTLTKSLPEPAV